MRGGEIQSREAEIRSLPVLVIMFPKLAALPPFPRLPPRLSAISLARSKFYYVSRLISISALYHVSLGVPKYALGGMGRGRGIAVIWS